MKKYFTIVKQIYEEDGTLISKRLLIVLLVFLFDPTAYAQVQLTSTEAGEAFKAGDYEKANY